MALTKGLLILSLLASNLTLTLSQCQNGGTFVTLPSGQTCCGCAAGFSGANCGMSDPTASNCVVCTNPDYGSCTCSDGSFLGKGKCSCFPGKALVTTKDAETGVLKKKRMSEVSVGDEVLSVKDGDLAFDKVFLLSHRREGVVVDDYVEIETEGHSITMSPGHFIWQVGVGLVRADCVHPNAVISITTDRGQMVEHKVNNTRTITGTGLYNPHTLSGFIIVNDVLASTYTDFLSPCLTHQLLWPLRQIYIYTEWGQATQTNLVDVVVDVGREIISKHY